MWQTAALRFNTNALAKVINREDCCFIYCPYCGKKLIEGTLNLGGGALFSQRKHRLTLAPRPGERYALRLGRPTIYHHYLPASFCPGCRRITVEGKGRDSNIPQAK